MQVTKRWLVSLGLASGCLVWSIGRSPEVPFDKIAIDLEASETCAFVDINGDGRTDTVSGEFWYEAPRWTPHRFRELNFT